MPHFKVHNNISNTKIKFIKSLRLKKYRIQENSFILEGEKNISQLLSSNQYTTRLLVATERFLKIHIQLLIEKNIEVYQVDETTLSSLGTFQENNAALAVATIRPNQPLKTDNTNYTLVLDNISDPGNLGTIIRIADWYNIPEIICSAHTVDLYNPKVLHASMGSFMHVNVYYTELIDYLSKTELPIIGAFTEGDNIHDSVTKWPDRAIIVIGNESRGINQQLMPYIKQKISIPRYGQAESLNAAIATAVICDNFIRIKANR